MRFLRFKQSGFTLIELLIVVAIFGMISGFLVIGFQNFASYQQFNQAVGDVDFVLNQSRVNARSAVDDESHGVRFAAGSITQFIGDTYSAVDPNNEVINYELVTIQANLTGGVVDVVFNKLTGLPSATGTVIVTGTRFYASTTIIIYDTGVIE